MRIKPWELDKGHEDAVRQVAQLGGCNEAQLLRFTPVRSSTKFTTINGTAVEKASVFRTRFRYCPHCVAEDYEAVDGPRTSRPWLRLEWMIKHFRSCDRHHSVLAEASPERHRFQSFDFHEALDATDVAEAAGETDRLDTSAFQTWLRARLDGMTSSSWLDSMPLHVAIAACEGFGLSSLQPPKFKVASLSELDWAAAADEGHRILAAGEESFRHLLEQLAAKQRHTRGYWGLRDTFGYGYGLLQQNVDDESYKTLRIAVQEAVWALVPIEAGTEVLGTKFEGRNLHTIRSAATESGVHSRSIRRLFRRKGFDTGTAEDPLRDHRVTVGSEEIATAVRKLKGALSTPQVIEQTRISRVHLSHLIARRYLATASGSENERNAKHRFAQEDIDALMAKLFEGAVPVEYALPHQRTISDARRVAGCELDLIFDRIFQGKLAWKGRLLDAEGYDALLVDADELARTVRTGSVVAGLTRRDVATFIPGLFFRAVQPLIDNGYLETEMEFSHNARREIEVVTRASAIAFRTSYITLGEIERVSGLHHSQIRPVLSANNVTRCFDSAVYATNIYERAEYLSLKERHPELFGAAASPF